MTLVRVPVPWRGVDLTSEPDTLVAGQGTLLRNLLPGRQGQLVPRGPLTTIGPTVTTTRGDAQYGGGGFWMNTNDTSPDFLQNVGATAQVASAVGTPFALPATVDYITAAYAALGSYTVGVTVPTGANTGRLMTWDGATALVAVTTGPAFPIGCVTHLNRVFTINNALSPGELRWTVPDPNLTANLAAAWQDPVSGLVNKIPLPPGGLWRDLITFNRTLYIIGSHGVFALMGDTPSSFVLRKVLDVGAGPATGWSSGGSSAATSQGIYFKSQNGLMRFDGVTAHVVSLDVAPSVSYGTYNSEWMQVLPLIDGYISVIVSGQWLLLHEPTGSWTNLTSSLFPATSLHNLTSGLPNLVRRIGDRWFAFNPGKSPTAGVYCEIKLNPENVASLLPGSATPATEWKDNRTNVIDAQAVSASIRLSGPDRMANLQRLYAQAGAGGWTVQVEDEAGTVIGNPATLVTGTQRARAQAEAFREIDIVRVRWTWDGVGLVRAPSVGDAHLLTDAAQQR